MKEFIIAFLLAMIATSWIFSTGQPPQASPVGVTGVAEATKRKTYEPSDSTYGDFLYTDKSQVDTYMTKIVNKSHGMTTHQTVPAGMAN